MPEGEDKLEKARQRIIKLGKLISALTVISGAILGTGNWITNQISASISTQIEDFRAEVRASNHTRDQAITRLELTNLIKDDPTNIVAIEKMARYYFKVLDGDQYMTGAYSNWAREYGGDITIVIGDD